MHPVLTFSDNITQIAFFFFVTNILPDNRRIQKYFRRRHSRNAGFGNGLFNAGYSGDTT